MPEPAARFLDLPLAEQAGVLHGLAPALGRSAEILEKDIWLCQVLSVRYADVDSDVAYLGVGVA